MVLDYRNISNEINDSGICTDVIGIHKGIAWGDAVDAFDVPDDFNGLPMIVIEREKGKDINLIFNDSKERNRAFDKLVERMKEKESNSTEITLYEAINNLINIYHDKMQRVKIDNKE